MEVQADAFWVQKKGTSENEYEDAFWPRRSLQLRDVAVWRGAVADGATEMAFSRIWAKLLVQCLCAGQGELCGDLVTRLPALRRRWLLGVGSKPRPWYAEAKAQAGAHAAVLGLELRSGPDESDGGSWDAVAAGDCCVAHVRDPMLVATFPVTDWRQLRSRPSLLSSNYSQDPKKHLLQAQGHWKSGDGFYLMTDALSGWFLREAEAGREPWSRLRALDPASGQTEFAGFVDQLRASGSIKNDDVTLLRVEVC